MKDGIIKADGTSRFMRASLPATYEEFRAMAAAGTLPLDVLFNAAGWSQQPTFLNKANLLKDTTAALFGLNNTAVPDDVFSILSRFHQGLGNEYLWHRVKENGDYKISTDVGTYGWIFNTSGDKGDDYPGYYWEDCVYGKSVSADESGVHIGDEFTPTVIPTYNDGNTWSEYVPFYFQPVGADEVYLFSRLSTINSAYGIWGKILKLQSAYTTEPVSYGYVNDKSPYAYPPSEDDGYTYYPLGQLGNRVQIEAGSYVGTGTYGADNPNSITFSFAPKLVMLTGYRYVESGASAIERPDGFIHYQYLNGNYAGFVDTAWLTPDVYAYGVSLGEKGSEGSRYCKISGDRKTLTWYHTYTSYAQGNASGYEYFYIAIG